MQDEQKTIKEDNKPASFLHQASDLAVSMLRTDWKLILLAYPILLVPHIIVLNVSELTEASVIFLSFLSRVISLSFLFIVCRRWLYNFTSTNATKPKLNVVAFFVFGFAQWLLYMLPTKGLLAVMTNQSKELALLELPILFFSIPAFFLALRLFFFFIPALLDRTSLVKVFQESLLFTAKDKLLALKVLIAPISISFLLSSLPLIISPDGRLLFSLYGSILFEGISWVLICYLALATVFQLMPEEKWRSYHLDPYRAQRFETLTFANPEWLSNLLRPKTGLKLLLVSTLVWLGNAMRAETLKPAVAVEVLNIELEGKNAAIKLKLQDDRYSFRGFIPAGFRLAGETGTPISSYPRKVVLDQTGEKIEVFMPEISGSAEITLFFECDRDAQSLRLLEDLYLYYRGYKYLHLDMESAKITSSSASAAKEAAMIDSEPPPLSADPLEQLQSHP